MLLSALTQGNPPELYESAEAPENIRCLTCRNQMKPAFKEFWSELNKPDRILFMYDCPSKCMPRRAFFSDGEEWRAKPNLCPRCDTKLEQEQINSEEKLVTKYTCSKCGYANTDELKWTRAKEELYPPLYKQGWFKRVRARKKMMKLQK